MLIMGVGNGNDIGNGRELKWVKFYIDDFLSSPAVAAMTTEQIGAYTLLLLLSTNGRGIPEDEKQQARMVRLSVEEWRKIAPEVLACFSIRKTSRAGYRLHNPRMLGEYEKACRISDMKSEGGRRAVMVRKQQRLAENTDLRELYERYVAEFMQKQGSRWPAETIEAEAYKRASAEIRNSRVKKLD